MSINVNVGNFIPENVVEVGNEISADQLAAITGAASPSATNPFSTNGHVHVISNITGLQEILDGKTSTIHNHVISDVTGLQFALDGKAGSFHTHTTSEITGLELALSNRALVTHTHVIADVTGLQTALDGKSDTTHLHAGVYAPVTHSHIISDTTGLQTALDGKASSTHNHDSAYAPLVHTHSIANITGLQTAIDSKANLSGATFTGRIGVGVAPDAVAALKVSSGGIMFNDGTVITTAPTGGGGGGAVTSVAGKTGAVVLNTADITGLQTTLNGKANLSGDTFTGTVHVPTLRNILNTDLEIVAYNDTGAGTTFTHKFDAYNGRLLLAPNGDGLTFPDGTSQTTAGIPLTGGTATGKVNFTAFSGNAGINIGIGGDQTVSTTAGDLWIATGGTILNYRDATGSWRQVLTTTQAGTIDVSSATAPALRITQRGAGNALLVEDSTNPDSSPFVIDANGRVGVGVAPSATAAIKVDAGGIMFNDGTTLTTAPVGGGGAVTSVAGRTGAVVLGISDITNLATQLSDKGSLSLANIWLGGVQSFSGRIQVGVATTAAAMIVSQSGEGNAFVVEDTANPDPTPFTISNSGRVGIGVAPSTTAALKVDSGGIMFNDGTVMTNASYAPLSGATFTGKVNLTPSVDNSSLNIGIGGTGVSNGDLWIPTSGVNLWYKDGTGVNRSLVTTSSINAFSQPQVISTGPAATQHALRITNQATTAGVHSLVVEDSVNPDTTPFVIDNTGKVGVGVAPSTAAVTVDNNGVKWSQDVTLAGQTYSGMAVEAITVVAGAGTDRDIYIKINGLLYKISAVLHLEI